MELRIYTDEQGRAPFDEWLNELTDRKARAIIRTRLDRVRLGNLDDCKSLRDGVQELRIDYGPGYRVYLSRQGSLLVLLLCGSDKSDQSKTIKRAIEYLNNWKQRGE